MKAPSKFDLLRGQLETAAFLVTQGGAARDAHAQIVRGLVLLAELESAYLKPISTAAPTLDTSEEINKVKRRLGLWVKRPGQINARILTAYLKLERSGSTKITEADLKSELRDEATFESNFLQMRILADKNHGKIFETYGDRVTLWPPVVPAIREFEKAIFGNT